ncbi:MAG: hypothetical protein COX57_12150 [Alphaproteobacteria bacterium CG_4_10_14_0_2_um_filter_63_37]|nr:MAG: hypothetical protein AUJ55_09640 [Proteobacteria bacterium CG1_02_64_396]PJA23728.1 MAG: hypothetical protein COX57_12150 [Alphaproteobacteria bacterium CG_4_10_14_0_2_um_filter_63_37]
MNCRQLRDDTVPESIPASSRAMEVMRQTVSLIHRLSTLPEYRSEIEPLLPEVARFDPGHHSAMMGYDFHLDADDPEGGMPTLIEVNTNAGGMLYLSRCLPPEGWRDGPVAAMFEQEWDLWRRGRGGVSGRPGLIAIVDEAPEGQFLYPEMRLFQAMFEAAGIATLILAPEAIQGGAGGLIAPDGRLIDLIYNRHTDFYLEEPVMAAIRTAYLNGEVCLTPNPRTYGLIGDKGRFAVWRQEGFLEGLGFTEEEGAQLRGVIPETRLLDESDPEWVWQNRNRLVFKPAARFGSRGVYMGRSISRKKLESLSGQNYLAQRLAPPHRVAPLNGGDPFKADVRLVAYQDQVLATMGRLYRGQVTGFGQGGGFVWVQAL